MASLYFGATQMKSCVGKPCHLLPPLARPGAQKSWNEYFMTYCTQGQPLFEEWLGLSAVPSPVETKFGANDALVIIDMQADFAPQSPTNPHGGRLGTPEAENLVPMINALTKAVLKAGGSVAATRDYHTIDHASFIAQGGPFHPHCVQGSEGSKFLPGTGATLAEARKEFGADRVMIAFKAFHEDVDSFGGIPYFDGGDGRICKASRATKPAFGDFCGCAKAPWTGAMILKCSNMEDVDPSGERCVDIDAPPDICAVIDDGFERGRRPLHEALKGRRLFVCGLVTDFCVVDTCINAKAAGFSEVYLIPDASRAVHIHGIGQHGTGHLTDPKETVQRAVSAGVQFTSVHCLLSSGQLQTALVPATTFPRALGPFGLLAAHVSCQLVPGADAYTIQSKDKGGSGSQGTTSQGTTSPRAKLPKGWPRAPLAAKQICWAYPCEGKLDAVSALSFTNVSASPEQCFLAYGGFLLLDAAGAVIAVQAVGGGSDLVFGPARPLRRDLTKGVEAEGRLRPVTLPDLMRGGAFQFCWIAPGETLQRETDKVVPSQTGAFLYTLANGKPPIYFQAMLTSKASAKRLKVDATPKARSFALTRVIGRASTMIDLLPSAWRRPVQQHKVVFNV